jgi:tellurite resistance protein TerC
MENTLWLWVGFNLFVLVLLALDLGVLHRREREISVAEALKLSLVYVVLAGAEAGYAFLTGYLIEKSLSLDNIFVFVLIFTHFAVPAAYQHRVLFWGILGALAMRAALIWAGAALLQQFHWVVFVFGGFLILTAIKMLWTINAKPDLTNNKLIVFARRHLRLTPDFVGQRFVVRRDGVLWATPLFLVLIVIELSDLVFAVDSIPAIFAVTSDPFIVYTANVFAILGLRALYFALAGIVHRFHYLKYGLSLVLLVIGAKMILNGIFGEKVVPVEWALVVTVVLIGGSMLLSLTRTRSIAGGAPTGWVPGSPAARDRDNPPAS